MSSVREMYSLSPIYDLNAKVDLPTSMYSLPVIQSSAGESIQSSESSSGAPAGYMDALEKRQESILTRLGQLKDQVSAYKQSIGLGPVPDAKPTTSPSKGCGCIADIVIKASPSRPPLSLPTICSLLQSTGYAVFMSTHTHSSVTGNKQKSFLPATVAGLSRGQADVRVTFIWAEVVGDCELMVSPLTQSVIKGEVSILRYFARVFDDEFMYESSPNLATIDCMLDTIATLPYSTPKNRPPMLRSVTSGLSKTSNLTGEDITIADLALFSYLKQADQGGNLQTEVKKWLDSMTKWSEELSADEGKKKSPRRRNYRRSHRTSHNHKEGPPEKKHRESEKEKSPKKEKSPQKPVKEEKGPSKERKKKKSPVIFDRVSCNSVGSFFTKQWPEVKHVFQSSNLDDYINEAKVGFVAEKLDGSNLGVSSRGVIASRRTILLNKPTDQQLAKYKFSGVGLESLVGIFEKLGKLESFFQKMLPFLEIEVIVYGELVQKGTASCKEDKFDYGRRGYMAGRMYAFGLGVAFEDNLSDAQMSKVVAHLVNKGFHTVIEHSDEGFKHVVLFMNKKLEKVLVDAEIEIIYHDLMRIEEVIESFENKLLLNQIEGIVVNFGTEILKWKGWEESYPDMYLNQIEGLHSVIQVQSVVESFKKVALKSRSERLKSKNFDSVSSQLEKAYTSAVSKLRPLAELLEEDDKADMKQDGIVEEFKKKLKGEMSRDALESHEFMHRLEQFIQEKTKLYTR